MGADTLCLLLLGKESHEGRIESCNTPAIVTVSPTTESHEGRIERSVFTFELLD